MKKKLMIFSAILLILIIGIILLFVNKNEKSFYLENSYYGTNKMIEVEIDELNELVDRKESFAVFVYQPMCVTSSDFEKVLSEFLEDNQISIYKIAFSSIKDTDIGKFVKYYPSFIIYHEGKMVDFLEANKDEDVNYYVSVDGFKNWFMKYVKIKEDILNENELSNNETSKEENNNLQDVSLDNVMREDNKVNIYFFWGNGCPHCEKEFEFFESIKEKYGDYYNLYTFETWYNEENSKLIYTFAEAMEEELKGVPYTIIGNKSFIGFNESYKKNIIKTIESQYQNSYDVYFDKIKKS